VERRGRFVVITGATITLRRENKKTVRPPPSWKHY
jgi:hypothetical protein